MSKTILVTGGCGFIGNHLVKELVAQRHKVVIIDNMITGKTIPRYAFAVLQKNVANIDWEDFLRLYEFDEIYWLASPASPPAYMKYKRETFQANVSALFDAITSLPNSKARFLFASTSEIYGDPLEHPQSESYFGNVNTLGPRSIYDESKRMGETILCSFGYNYIIARIFNTYGPGMLENDGRLLTNIFKAMKNKETLQIYGDGHQTRSMCFVQDTVRGLITLMERGEMQQVYNVGNPDEHTILEILRTCEEITDIRPAKELAPLPENDPIKRRPDISKVQGLEWTPKVGLKEGLKIMWEEFNAR